MNATALTGRRGHACHAALLDPHTTAELAPGEIRARHTGSYLPHYH